MKRLVFLVANNQTNGKMLKTRRKRCPDQPDQSFLKTGNRKDCFVEFIEPIFKQLVNNQTLISSSQAKINYWIRRLVRVMNFAYLHFSKTLRMRKMALW